MGIKRALRAALFLALPFLAPPLALAQYQPTPLIGYNGGGSGLPPVINGECLIGVSGQPVWGSCSGTGTAVTSVTSSGGSLTFSPTTGAVVGAINLAHANNFTALQTYTGGATVLSAFTATGLVTNADLVNPGLMIAGHSVSLGGSQTLACADLTGVGTGCSANIANYLPLAGGTMTGELATVASTTSTAGFNIPQGSAPTSPVNGDMWATSAGVFVRIAGVTVGPLGTGSGSGINQLTGDVTAGPGSGSQVATLAASGVTAGTYGDATHVPQFAVDSKGRITAVSLVAITGAGSVSLSSSSNNVCVNPNPITGTGTVGACFLNNAQTGTTYTVGSGSFGTDNGVLITGTNVSAITHTWPATSTTGFGAGYSTTDCNIGIAALGLASTSGWSPASVVLAQGQCADVTSLGSGNSYNVSDVSLPYMGANTVLGNNTGSNAWPVAIATTGSGAVVRAGAPTLTLTNATLLPIAGITGLGTGVGTALAITHDTSGGLCTVGGGGCTGSGTVTTSGSPASGNLAKFSSGTVVTNGDASGDCTTSGTLSFSCTKFNGGTSFGSAAGVNTGTSGATIGLLNGNNTYSGNNSHTGRETNGEKALTGISNVFTPDSTSNEYSISPTANFTIANDSGTMVNGTRGEFRICQDATGSRIPTWGSQYYAQGGVATIVLSTAANVCDLIGYRDVDSTHRVLVVESQAWTH